MESTEPPDVGFSGSESTEAIETGKKFLLFLRTNMGRMCVISGRMILNMDE